MSSYRVYRVPNSTYEEFDEPIEESRLVLTGRYWIENGKEIAHELYDEAGGFICRNETVYNDRGDEIENREFTGNLKVPFKYSKKEYNAAGQITADRAYFDGELASEVIHTYDHLGRIIEVSDRDEDEVLQSITYHYDGNHPKPFMESHWGEGKCWQEVKMKYSLRRGTYLLIEEYTDNKLNRFLSRIRKLYDIGEIPNGVVEEVYNENGDFLEECREVVDAKGRILLRGWHTDDADDSPPYRTETYWYDNGGNCIKEERTRHGKVNYLHRELFDKRNRKIREYQFMDTSAEILVYKYED